MSVKAFIGGLNLKGIFFKNASGNQKISDRAYHKNSSGVVQKVWERTPGNSPLVPSGGVGGGGPPVDPPPVTIPDDEAIYNYYGMTLNIDQIQSREQSAGSETAHITTYLNTLRTRCNAQGHQFAVERDDMFSNLNTGVAYTTPNWFNLWQGHAISNGAVFFMHYYPADIAGWPGAAAGAISTQANWTLAQMIANYTTFKARLQWQVYAKMNNATVKNKTRVMIAQNEQDNVGIGSNNSGFSAYSTVVRDFGNTAALTADGLKLARRRHVFIQKVAYEQLHAITQNASTNMAEVTDVYMAWPSLAFPSRTNQDANQKIYFVDMCAEYNGIIFDYVDIISVHMHRVMSNMESYTNQPPADNAQSMYHICKIIEETNALRVANGMAVKKMPVMIDEAGLLINSPPGWETSASTIGVPSDASPTYTYDTGNCAFRLYRMGGMILEFCWYGLIAHVDYVIAYSGAYNYYSFQPNQSVNDSVDGLPMKVMHDWREHFKTWNFNLYDINLFTQGSFPNKSWNEYYKAYTWGAYIPMGTAAVNSLASGLPPYNGWRNITFGADGVVTMTSTYSVGRNLIFRPVWLRKPTLDHTVSVEINFPTVNANAKAKLRVRGYDKLNGLANSEVEVVGNDTAATGSNWKTVSVTVTHVGHGLAALNPVNYLLFCCDHNCVGTVRFRNPRVDYVAV